MPHLAHAAILSRLLLMPCRQHTLLFGSIWMIPTPLRTGDIVLDVLVKGGTAYGQHLRGAAEQHPAEESLMPQFLYL